MPKTHGKPADLPPKRRLAGTVAGFRKALRRVKRSEHHWFDHPEMQARVAEAEADFLNGRSYHTDSPEAVEALFDSWK